MYAPQRKKKSVRVKGESCLFGGEGRGEGNIRQVNKIVTFKFRDEVLEVNHNGLVGEEHGPHVGRVLEAGVVIQQGRARAPHTTIVVTTTTNTTSSSSPSYFRVVAVVVENPFRHTRDHGKTQTASTVVKIGGGYDGDADDERQEEGGDGRGGIGRRMHFGSTPRGEDGLSFSFLVICRGY